MTSKTPTDEEVRRLIIERLRVTPPDLSISIGADENYTQRQLIDHIKKGDKVGKKISEIELNYLRTIKSPEFLQSLDE